MIFFTPVWSTPTLAPHPQSLVSNLISLDRCRQNLQSNQAWHIYVHLARHTAQTRLFKTRNSDHEIVRAYQDCGGICCVPYKTPKMELLPLTFSSLVPTTLAPPPRRGWDLIGGSPEQPTGLACNDYFGDVR